MRYNNYIADCLLCFAQQGRIKEDNPHFRDIYNELYKLEIKIKKEDIFSKLESRGIKQE